MMISKQDAAKYLQSQGYDADVSSDGVVVVYLAMNEMTAATLRKIKKTLEGIGYNSSWGGLSQEGMQSDRGIKR